MMCRRSGRRVRRETMEWGQEQEPTPCPTTRHRSVPSSPVGPRPCTAATSRASWPTTPRTSSCTTSRPRTRASTASPPTAPPGRRSSTGRPRAPASTSTPSTSRPARTWPTPKPCSGAAPRGVRRTPQPAAAAHLRPAQGTGPVAGRPRAPLVPARLTRSPRLADQLVGDPVRDLRGVRRGEPEHDVLEARVERLADRGPGRLGVVVGDGEVDGAGDGGGSRPISAQ